jgi:hypothetical protein
MTGTLIDVIDAALYGHAVRDRIAAAPDLLAALMEVKGFSVTEVTHCAGRKCRESHCADCNSDEYAEWYVAEAGEAYRKANAAIAKAAGEAP